MPVLPLWFYLFSRSVALTNGFGEVESGLPVLLLHVEKEPVMKEERMTQVKRLLFEYGRMRKREIGKRKKGFLFLVSALFPFLHLPPHPFATDSASLDSGADSPDVTSEPQDDEDDEEDRGAMIEEALSKLMSMKTLPGSGAPGVGTATGAAAAAPTTPDGAAAAGDSRRKIYSTRFPISYRELRESRRGRPSHKSEEL